ncbi:DNA replication and repair protein RecF [Candidatus Saccharibacteria bacterium]|nr:DNA replication and repair protein RecF [Candidatus Saccharibacteria bacterium]
MNIISKIEVRNFRSHGKYLLELKNPTTLIIGENGSGKTSLIEALYISLRGKSFRSSDSHIVKDGTNSYKITTVFTDHQKRTVEYINGQKTFKCDDKKYLRLPTKLKYPVTLFEPADLNLVHSSPNSRRRFLDTLISQLDETYHTYLIKYEKALKQRNKLLGLPGVRSDDIFAWNVILADIGSKINTKRAQIVNSINTQINDIYKSIASNNDQVGIRYSGQVLSETDYLKDLDASLSRDIALGYTSVGPHREDLEFIFNGKPAISTASRGEIRSIILSLKFIEASLVKEYLGHEPIIMLDDIFSELDSIRQLRLVNNFKNHQVIITSVDAPRNMQEDVRL